MASFVGTVVAGASAETVVFIGPAGGSWFFPANWSSGALPVDQTATSNVPFEVDGPGAQAAVIECTADGSGYTMLAGLGATLSTGSQLIAAAEGVATVVQYGGQSSPGLLAIGVGGTGQYIQYGGTITGACFSIGNGSGHPGMLDGDGLYERFGGSATASNLYMGAIGHNVGVFRQHAGATTLTGEVWIGQLNSGQPSRLEILGGSFSCNSALVGATQLGKGIVTVESATWNVEGNMKFGQELAWGHLFVRDGGAVNAQSAYLAGGTEGVATFSVQHAGSIINIDEEMTASEAGTQTTIEVLDGGSITTGEARIGGLAHQFFGGPNLIIDGPASGWFDSGDVFELRSWDGVYDNATIRVSNGGRLETFKFKPINAYVYGDGGVIDGKFVNLGACSPGTASSHLPQFVVPSFGQLTVTGLYTQTGNYIDNNDQTVYSTGSLRIEIGGQTPVTQHDVLNIGGPFKGRGDLTAAFVNGYSPAIGTTFQIISCGSIDDEFDTVITEGFNDNRDVAIDYIEIAGGPDQIRVRVTSECPADLNGNEVVNVQDLLMLISAWGPCPDGEYCAADLTADGLAGAADLLVVVSSWGACP